MLKTFTLIGILAASSTAANANCYGSSQLSTCYDSQSGNNYTVQRFGDTTITNGSNGRTGSSWSQTDQRIGGTTFSNGRAGNGNSWNSTQQDLGGGYSSRSSTDSRGRNSLETCGPFGCN